MNDSQTISVRLSAVLAESFSRLCAAQRRSKTEVVRMLIEEAVRKEGGNGTEEKEPDAVSGGSNSE